MSIYNGLHKPIIDDDTFLFAQSIFNNQDKIYEFFENEVYTKEEYEERIRVNKSKQADTQKKIKELEQSLTDEELRIHEREEYIPLCKMYLTITTPCFLQNKMMHLNYLLTRLYIQKPLKMSAVKVSDYVSGFGTEELAP